MMTTPVMSIKKERLSARSEALYGLGFSYKTDSEIFLYKRKDRVPLIVTLHFVVDTDNDTFFSEYVHLRKSVLNSKV